MQNRFLSLLILFSEMGLYIWYLWDVPKRKRFAGKVPFSLGLLILLAAWYFIRSVIYDSSFITVFLLLFAASAVLYELSITKAIYLSSIFTAYIYASGIVLLFPLILIGKVDVSNGMLYDREPMLLVVELGLFCLKLLSVGLFRRLIPNLLKVKLNGIQLINAFLPIIFAVAVDALSPVLITSQHGGNQNTKALFIVLLGLYIYISTACAALSIRYQYRDVENLQIQQAMKMQYEKYENSRTQEEEIRKLNHDLKNHLIVISQMNTVPAVRGYIRSILGQYSSIEHIHYTNNVIVDSLINAKAGQMQENGITMKVVADLSKLRGIEDTDLCAIIGNALDNAIEATSLVPETDKRIISMKMFPQSGMWVLLVSNYYDGNLLTEAGALKSTHGSSRGLGLKSIQYALKRYDGHCTIETTEDYFTLKAAWPAAE